MAYTSQLVLVINCGSSSLKFAVIPALGGAPLASGLAECLGLAEARLVIKSGETKTSNSLHGGAHDAALAAILRYLDEQSLLDRIVVVGHRVVHGGERFTASALVTPEVLADIEAVSALAPLHGPANLLGIRACSQGLPSVPQVVVFDTAFHQTMPCAAFTYAIPQHLYRDFGVRRYGFHGTSHRYVARQAVELLRLDPQDHGIVIAHLGNGASATAVSNGESVDTTMGMTPIEGLVMGTRCGDIDFGAVAHIARTARLSLDEVDAMLNKESGLLGISELSSDCRTLEQAAKSGHAGAILALDVFVHRLARHIGGLAASLDNFDALVFTGGIGENSALIRAKTIESLRVFGFTLNREANERMFGGRSGRISRSRRPTAVVIPTDEEGLIANDAATLVGIFPATGVAAQSHDLHFA
ncbi:acetate/propionate family kinase [Rhodopseudomonas palustris]|uniref:Acetate kinase n=1 Tax=Rhodopseudomonas palustris (strain BisB18) TaxID=316056 RepID=Q21AE4_RHOPB